MSGKQLLPQYFKIAEKIDFDNSCEYSSIFQVPPSDGNKQATLNSNATVLTFSYKGDSKFVRLGSPKSGFRIRASFLTQGPAGTNNHDAITTLSSNWAMHLFRLIEFKIGAESIESIEHPGIATDIMYHTLGTEFKQDDGSLNTFIPDSSLSADINLVNTPTFVAGGVGDGAGIVNTLSK